MSHHQHKRTNVVTVARLARILHLPVPPRALAVEFATCRLLLQPFTRRRSERRRVTEPKSNVALASWFVQDEPPNASHAFRARREAEAEAT